MSLDEVRKILGGIAVDMSDEELNNLITQCRKIASIIVDFAEKELQN